MEILTHARHSICLSIFECVCLSLKQKLIDYRVYSQMWINGEYGENFTLAKYVWALPQKQESLCPHCSPFSSGKGMRKSTAKNRSLAIFSGPRRHRRKQMLIMGSCCPETLTVALFFFFFFVRMEATGDLLTLGLTLIQCKKILWKKLGRQK